MKFKEFLAMDNIEGKRIVIVISDKSHNVKIPINVIQPFKTDGGHFLGFTHEIFNAECEILETTVADFFNRNHPNITYTHKIDKCGWNKYHICLGFQDCSICVDSEDEKELEEKVCHAINKKFNLDLEPSNLDFLK